MRNANSVRVPDEVVIEFEDDELDWLIGEFDHAVDRAKKLGMPLCRFDPALAQAAVRFFQRYHLRLDLGQSRPDFEAVRISDEEWARRFREKIRRICVDPTAKRGAVRPWRETTE